MAEDEAPGADGAPSSAAEDEEPHRPDGLDLAKSLVRGAAHAGAAAARKPFRRTRGAQRRGRRPGDDIAMSGAHPDDRDPQTLDAELGRLVEDQGWRLDLQVRGVFGRWEEIVGPEIADHSTPETLTDGTLVVRTDSTAWATQLRLLAPNVVRRLNTELGDGTVRVVDVRGPHAPSWKHGRRGLRDGRGPRDTYG
ncbi:DciA family protein [Nocardioides panacisoli]|uniref:DUF721 domain-containing protein n=1 Tax=Nocardioides panacisoli TaxID=627624 RepID=UPI001C62E254|nr:DciA family protein [Nocardioides panacisoli]QYJ03279.1 DciA family protein [Nocardioides panacisoli]